MFNKPFNCYTFCCCIFIITDGSNIILSSFLQSGFCGNGSWWGTSTAQCDNWQWEQCIVTGKIALFGGLGVVLLLICFMITCCVCCLCNPCKKKKEDKYKSFVSSDINAADEEKSLINPATPISNAERQRMATKYGDRFQLRDSGSTSKKTSFDS